MSVPLLCQQTTTHWGIVEESREQNLALIKSQILEFEEIFTKYWIPLSLNIVKNVGKCKNPRHAYRGLTLEKFG